MKRTLTKRFFAFALVLSMLSTGFSMSTVFAAKDSKEPEKKVYTGPMIPVSIDTKTEEFQVNFRATDVDWSASYEQKKDEDKVSFLKNGKKIKTLDIEVPNNIPVEVEIRSSEFEYLSEMIVSYEGGKPDTNVDIDVTETPVHTGYRNASTTFQSERPITLSFSTVKSKHAVPFFDKIADRLYFESLLCGDDCLEKHVRAGKPCTEPKTTLQGDSPLRQGLTAMWMAAQEDSDDRDLAVPYTLGFTPTVGATYSGTASIVFEVTVPNPGEPGWTGTGIFSGNFSDGELDGESYSNFVCQDPGAANPGENTPGPRTGTYTAECKSVDTVNGTASFWIFIETGGNGYQDIGGWATMSYTPPKGGLSVSKVSANGTLTNGNSNYSLTGAKYNIYNSAGGYVQQITTGSNGVASTADDALDAGTYTVREAEPSKGYSLDTNSRTIEVTAGEKASANVVTSHEPPKTGKIELTKTSTHPDITNGNKCYTLKGAVYGVYTDASCTREYGRITTDENGKGSISGLPFGKYWIREITPPTGYYKDDTIYPKGGQGLSITETKNAVTTVRVDTQDKPMDDPAGIEISKIWDGAKTDTVPPLDGTQFTICYYDGYFTKDNLPDFDSYQSTAKRKWVIEVKYNPNTKKYIAGLLDNYLVKDISNELYKRDGHEIIPLGTISIQETKPAPGYTLEGAFIDKHGNKFSPKEKYVTQIVNSTSGVAIQGGNKYSAENTPVYGSIKLKKLDSDGKTPLPQAQFEIRNKAGDYVTTKTTDSKGEVLFSDLYPDVYTITEVKTPGGRTLLKEPIVVRVPTYLTEEEVNKYGVDKDNCIYDPKTQKYLIHDFTYTVTNHSTFDIPSTGGFTNWMTFLPLIAGLGILLSLGIFGFYYQKRRY